MDEGIDIIRDNSDYKFPKKKFVIYSYKFPNKTIYLGFTSHGLEYMQQVHTKNITSPIYESLKLYPDVYPQVEKTIENVSFNDLDRIRRDILDSYPNWKRLNYNLDYQPA